MRNERYSTLLPIDRLADTACTIVGVGAIGRQLALQLAALGVGRIQLVDYDDVEEVNLGTQAYLEDDVGRPKVEATATLMRRLNSTVDIELVPSRFARSLQVNPAVFSCVDSIRDRRHICSALEGSVEVLIDGRMAAEVLRVLTVDSQAAFQRYRRTFFRDQDAVPQPCTARSTIYCANIAAGFMVSQFSKWVRGMPVDFDVIINLLSLETTVQ